MSDDITTNIPETGLENLLAVAQYLKKQGYRVSKSTVYNHKNEGKLRPDKATLKYILADVDKYAAAHLERVGASTAKSAKLDKQISARADAGTRERIARAENWEIRNKALKGELVPKEAFTTVLAAQAITLKSDDENWIYSTAAEIIQTVQGDPSREPDLIDFLRTSRESMFARYTDKIEFVVDMPANLITELDGYGDHIVDPLNA